MQPTRRIIYWLRNDLRLHDNAVFSALEQLGRAAAFLPVFVEDAYLCADRCSERRRAWTINAVCDLSDTLRSDYGVPGIHWVRGNAVDVLEQLCRDHAVDEVFCSSEHATEERQQEDALIARKIKLRRFDTMLCVEQARVSLDQLPLSYSKFRFKMVPSLLPMPKPLSKPRSLPNCFLQNVALPQRIKIDTDRRSAVPFESGEKAALHRLEDYVARGATKYHVTRNGLVGAQYSTKFSVFFATGALSPRLVWDRTLELCDAKAREALQLELLWRDYFRLLCAKTGRAFFGWKGLRGQKPPAVEPNEEAFRKWCRGETGNRFVDANMKELLATGFMSNRGRQNVASYLIFDLKQDWRRGALFFEQHLLDHDVCSNTGNWKYISGTGTDVRDTSFDVEQQRKRYDPKGEYTRLWAK